MTSTCDLSQRGRQNGDEKKRIDRKIRTVAGNSDEVFECISRARRHNEDSTYGDNPILFLAPMRSRGEDAPSKTPESAQVSSRVFASRPYK